MDKNHPFLKTYTRFFAKPPGTEQASAICSLCHQNREIPHYATLRAGNEVTRFPVCKECGIRLSGIMDDIQAEQEDEK